MACREHCQLLLFQDNFLECENDEEREELQVNQSNTNDAALSGVGSLTGDPRQDQKAMPKYRTGNS